MWRTCGEYLKRAVWRDTPGLPLISACCEPLSGLHLLQDFGIVCKEAEAAQPNPTVLKCIASINETSWASRQSLAKMAGSYLAQVGAALRHVHRPIIHMEERGRQLHAL